LKVIQHGVRIAIFWSGQPAGLEIAIKMASIGEGDYQVVKKEPLFVCGLFVCLFFPELRKI
jgi:hypothetical protein